MLRTCIFNHLALHKPNIYYYYLQNAYAIYHLLFTVLFLCSKKNRYLLFLITNAKDKLISEAAKRDKNTLLSMDLLQEYEDIFENPHSTPPARIPK